MRNSLAFVVASLVACGGPTKGPEDPTGGGGSGGGAKPTTPGDVSFEIQTQEIKGLTFEPDALGSPGMPLVEAKKKTTIEKQRATFQKTKDPVQKEAHAAILATMLYVKAKDAKEDDQKKLYEDARQVLRDAAQNSGEKVDEITLRMLGSYELLLGDYESAEKAWSGYVGATPKDKDLATNKAWWAYSLLKQHKNAEALAVVNTEPLNEKQPELAYVTAWAKFRTGDPAGAWQAIIAAAKGWGSMANRDVLDRNVLFFAGRTDTSLQDAVTALTPLYAKTKEQKYQLLANLGLKSYQFAGRWADGVEALEMAMNAGATVGVNDRPVIRYQQADYTVRLDDPAKAAKFALQAVDALPACGAKCTDQEKANIVLAVNVMGKLFHLLYATAHDDRYYQPAHDIYAATVSKITFDDRARAEAQQYADTLEKSFKTMRAGVGTHDKPALGALLGRHNQEVQACYELGLAANPKLVGNLTLTLESDQDGGIKGVSTEPKAGLADMSLVASCVAERAKNWQLPKRAQPGTTRIKIPYSMNLLKKS